MGRDSPAGYRPFALLLAAGANNCRVPLDHRLRTSPERFAVALRPNSLHYPPLERKARSRTSEPGQCSDGGYVAILAYTRLPVKDATENSRDYFGGRLAMRMCT